MTRLTSIAAFAAVTALGVPAFAQSQAEIAARLNDEGKEQMYSNNYAQASGKFREAVARVPEPKYFFNLCTSLFQEGKFGEALTACEAVEKNNPTPDLQGKATKMIGKIKAEAQTQGLKIEPEGGGGLSECNSNPNAAGCAPPPTTCQQNPSAPECQPRVQQPPPVVGRPPTGTGVFATVTPDNKYVWTIGGELFAGGGKIGQQFLDGENVYGTAAAGFRLKGDYMFNPAQRIGGQVYLQYSKFTEGQEQTAGAPSLDVIDTGVGLYKHLCPHGTERLCLTPLIGAHLSFLSPQGNENFDGSKVFNYVSAGGRAEISLQYAFGNRMEHVLNVSLGANFYSSVLAGPSADNADCPGAPGGMGFDGTEVFPDQCPTAGQAGLDKGGAFGYIGIGYTHRFSTPLGSSPFITLE